MKVVLVVCANDDIPRKNTRGLVYTVIVNQTTHLMDFLVLTFPFANQRSIYQLKHSEETASLTSLSAWHYVCILEHALFGMALFNHTLHINSFNITTMCTYNWELSFKMLTSFITLQSHKAIRTRITIGNWRQLIPGWQWPSKSWKQADWRLYFQAIDLANALDPILCGRCTLRSER